MNYGIAEGAVVTAATSVPHGCDVPPHATLASLEYKKFPIQGLSVSWALSWTVGVLQRENRFPSCLNPLLRFGFQLCFCLWVRTE